MIQFSKLIKNKAGRTVSWSGRDITHHRGLQLWKLQLQLPALFIILVFGEVVWGRVLRRRMVKYWIWAIYILGLHFILEIILTLNHSQMHLSCWAVAHLAVCINYRSQQLPGAPSTVHPQHAQDLQKPQAPDGWGGKNVALRSSSQHRQWGDQHHDVLGKGGGLHTVI